RDWSSDVFSSDLLFTIYQENKDEAAKEGIDPFVLTELIYGMENELVYKPVDFFIRRTGALLFDINWVKEHKESVINYMAKSLNWSKEQKEAYTEELEVALNQAQV